MRTTPKARTEWQRIELRMEFGFLALVLAVVATFLVVISNGTPSVALDTSPVTAAKFSGEVVGIKAISNNLVSVRYVVKNISSPSGTPICSIYVADPSGSFPGYSNELVMKSIKGGQNFSSYINIPLHSPGSRYVTQGSVSCR